MEVEVLVYTKDGFKRVKKRLSDSEMAEEGGDEKEAVAEAGNESTTVYIGFDSE